MKRVLAVNPLISDFAAYDLWAYPVGFLFLLSYLEKIGFEIDYLDCRDREHPLIRKKHPPKNKKYHTGPYYKKKITLPPQYKNMDRSYYLYGLPEESIREYLKGINRPDYILVTSMMTYWYPGIDYTLKIIKDYFPQTPVILGGMYVNLCYEHSLTRKNVDLAINWERLNEFFSFIKKGDKYDFYQTLPFLAPAYHLYQKLPAASWLTSMGCPYQCDVCAAHYLYKKIIPFSITENANSLIRIIRKKKIKDLAFADDALLIDKDKHFFPWIFRIIHENLTFNFHTPNGLHLRFLDLETARLMKKANFKTIRLSLESSLPQTQSSMDDKTNNRDFENAVENLLSAGFSPNQLETYILMGLPGQSLEDVMESVFFVLRKNIKIILASYSPIPHTKLYNKTIIDDPDPLYHNNTYYYHYDDEDKNQFKKVRKLVSFFNHGIDSGINLFSDPFYRRFFDINTITR